MNSQSFARNGKETWAILLEALEKHKNENQHGFWTDGHQILCKTEDEANTLADFLEDLGFEYVNTGYYDPVEDEEENCVDDHTGFHYVSVD